MGQIENFHKSLVGSDPTPKQRIVYDILGSAHGVLRNDPDREEFVAIFIASLASTVCPLTREYRTVYLIMPDKIEQWATDTINSFLQALRKVKIDPEAKKRRNKGLVLAVQHLMRGGRVWSLNDAPPHWVAYGFSESTPMPDWLKEGQLSEPVYS